MSSTADWNDYLKYRISPPDAATLRHSKVQELLAAVLSHRQGALRIREIGNSVAGRSISLVSIGEGATQVLLWSQMHGDEPTHTAVLLDLLNFFVRAPESPTASAVLSGSTLHMIPMLNPDGAERGTRRNAQQIDVNRDARQLATPEGRALQVMVDELRPQFAFNLHNQHPRSAVSGTLQPAAVSLLVPPRDAHATDTESTRRAKRVAAALLCAVEPHCSGAVSRYRADYMPRAFGEAIQRQGVSTVLVEAGSWRGKRTDELVQLHWIGLLAALHAIATDSLARFDIAAYENLPLSAEHRLFDIMLRNATIVGGIDLAPYACDIGVAIPRISLHEQGEQQSIATIEDMGDLSVTSAEVILDEGGICLSGRIVVDDHVTPLALPQPDHCQRLLRCGITTLIGTVDVANSAAIAALAALRSDARYAINLGFIASVDSMARFPSATWWESLLLALGHGALAITVHDESSEVARILRSLPLSVLARSELPATVLEEEKSTVAHLAAQNWAVAQQLGLGHRGSVRCGAAADLLLSAQQGDVDQFDPDAIRNVIVNGVHAVSDGKVIRNDAGRLLRRIQRHVPDR